MFIHLTVDTEFSAGGHWDNPELPPVLQPNVWCDIDGESHGLGFLLRVLGERQLTATFFVETLHTVMLGTDEMRPAVQSILRNGHSVEIHAHPMWLSGIDGHPGQAPNDKCAQCTPAEMATILELSRAAFADWGAPPPTAFRSGGLSASLSIYRALADGGVRIASNIGLAVAPPAEPILRRTTGRFTVEGVVEVPITTYDSFDPRPNVSARIVTTTSTGFTETTALIEQAAAAGLEDFVILTHPFEFIKANDTQLNGLRPNWRVQKRLEQLVDWLAERQDRFPTSTFAARAPAWLADPDRPEVALSAPTGASLVRAVQNALDGPDRRTNIPVAEGSA